MFILKFRDKVEKRELPHDKYTIRDLLNDLGLSSQTMVSKQNGEIVIEDAIIKDDDEIVLIQIIYGG